MSKKLSPIQMALLGGAGLVGYSILSAKKAPTYTSGPLKGRVNLTALWGQEYGDLVKKNGQWDVSFEGASQYTEYRAKLTPAEADNLIHLWEDRIIRVSYAERDKWARWEASFIEKHSVYSKYLWDLTLKLLTDAGHQLPSCSVTSFRGANKVPMPVLSCFTYKEALIDGKWFEPIVSIGILYQLRTMIQALATFEILAETVEQPRFSDELPWPLSTVARAGECFAIGPSCWNKYIPGLPKLPDLGNWMNLALYGTVGYIGYKVLIQKK